ncbi:MAG: hypothetical protein WCW52_12045 [Elusimicrobiales bacterium]|jgi:hypothetical protein
MKKILTTVVFGTIPFGMASAGEMERTAASADMRGLSFKALQTADFQAPEPDEAAQEPAVRQADMNTAGISCFFEEPVVGVDYPAGSLLPSYLTGRKILVIETQRIAVEENAILSEPVSGVDYRARAALPEWAVNGKVIVFKDGFRLAIRVGKAKAGLDYPAGGPLYLNGNYLVWGFSAGARFPLNHVYGITRAVAGIDFPAGGQPDLEGDFYVVLTFSRSGLIRTRI